MSIKLLNEKRMDELIQFIHQEEITKEYLKQNNIEYSIHGVGGCTCCGLELRQEGKRYQWGYYF